MVKEEHLDRPLGGLINTSPSISQSEISVAAAEIRHPESFILGS